jgi:DNA-binding PadR family transcriptional regulator
VSARAVPRLLGEWACLGLLVEAPAHGFALAARLAPSGDVGRVWSMSRPLTYRSLDQLDERGLVEQVGVEPGRAGGQRVVLGTTAQGRAVFDTWIAEPVVHLRDLRSELLLKLVLLDLLGRDASGLLMQQRDLVAAAQGLLERDIGRDVVGLWRAESAAAALRFLDRLVVDLSRSRR